MVHFNINDLAFLFPQNQTRVSLVVSKQSRGEGQSVLVMDMIEILFIYLDKLLHQESLSESAQDTLSESVYDCLLTFTRLLDHSHII